MSDNTELSPGKLENKSKPNEQEEEKKSDEKNTSKRNHERQQIQELLHLCLIGVPVHTIERDVIKLLRKHFTSLDLPLKGILKKRG